MNLRVELLSGADADLQHIFNQLEGYREGFGVEFMTVVDAYLAHLATFPEMAPIYLENIRRLVMQRFPYDIFYQALPSRIVVTAILDLRQDDATIIRQLS